MVDYSKWNHIEVSDDEDETSPSNVDPQSFYRWRHESRLERMADMDRQKKELKAKRKTTQKQIEDIQKRMTQEGDANIEYLKKKIAELMIQDSEEAAQSEELLNREKQQPLNVDTICKEVFCKTTLNKPKPPNQEEVTEIDSQAMHHNFLKANDGRIKTFAALRRYNDSRAYLEEYSQLVCESVANYLILRCINLAMAEDYTQMHYVCHQCLSIQYIMEYGSQMNLDPRECISAFYRRIELADKIYRDGFIDELEAFKSKIRVIAKERIEHELKSLDPGPGGLSPLEVLQSLPEDLRKCFASKDKQHLQQILSEMPMEEACCLMTRLTDAGLWIPDSEPSIDAEDEFQSALNKPYSMDKEIK